MYASLALACNFSIPNSNFKAHKQPPLPPPHTHIHLKTFSSIIQIEYQKIRGSLKEITNQINKLSYYYHFQVTSLTNLKGFNKPNLQKLQITSIG